MLESLGMVYGNDAMAREQGLDAEARLRFHQQYSGPLMDQLHGWLEEQLAEAKTEPNSGLGKAISYLLNHWQPLTLFLREKGAPLDNNLCERALKKAILNRKNAMFYKTPERSHGGRSVHEPYPYLRTQWREPVPVSDRTAAALSGGETRAGRLDAVELRRDAGAHANSRCGVISWSPDWPETIDSGRGQVTFRNAQKTPLNRVKSSYVFGQNGTG